MNEAKYREMYKLEGTYWWFRAKRLFAALVLGSEYKKLHILDIGSGTGGMSKFFSRYGQVTCIEPSPFATSFLEKRNLHFLKVPVERYKPRKLFDIITICDVLYHKNIKGDKRVLQKAYQWLKPGGSLLVMDCAVPELYGYYDMGMHGRERYTLGDMVKNVKSVGFNIEKASYIFFLTFPFFVVTRWFQNMTKGVSIEDIPPFLNSLLFQLCTVEGILLKFLDFPMGSSVLVLARKPGR